MYCKFKLLFAFCLLLVGFLPGKAFALTLYKIEKRALGQDNQTGVYQIVDYQELKNGEGNGCFSPSSIELEEGSCWVLSSVYPKLYSQDSGGNYDFSKEPEIRDFMAGEVEIYSEADSADGSTAVVYRVSDAAKGTPVFKNVTEETATYSLAAPVYFKYLDWAVLSGYSTTRTLEMLTEDGETYHIDRLALSEKQCFNISEANDFSGKAEYKKVTPGVVIEIPSSYAAEVQSQLVGSVKALRNGDAFSVTLTPADPTPVFMSILESKSAIYKTASYIEFEVNEDRTEFDYDFVADVPVVSDGQRVVITYDLPVVGETIASTLSVSATEINQSDMAVATVADKKGKELEFGYQNLACPYYTFPDGNFHGKIYLSAKKNADGSTVDNAWVGKVVISRDAESIMDEFASNNDLLDKEVNGANPLKYSAKPILHDNASRSGESSVDVPNPDNEGSVAHDLIYMERRRALTGVDCNINCMSPGALASVVNVQNNLGNLTSHDLSAPAEFVGVANVKLTAAPLVSVRDEKHYFARGTEAGFNLASGTGTNVLSLSVIETLSIAFYRDGNLMAVVPASSKSGKGVDLSLVSISSGGGSYDIKAVSPVVFDEVALYNTGGLKLEVGSGLTVNYAFAGKEENSEVTLGSNGRAAYNEKMRDELKAQGYDGDYELYVYSYSTPAHINGGTVKSDTDPGKTGNFVGDEAKSENLTNILSLGTLGNGWAEIKLDVAGKNAPKDYEQIFPKGSRVSFRIKSSKVLNLGVGTGNTITFFTRKNVVRNDDGSIKSIGWGEKKVVLSATVLQLGVASFEGDQLVSMVAPCDFSGVRLDINDGLVNLGGTNVYYASVTPQPEQQHKCELGFPSKIFLEKTKVVFIDQDGSIVPGHEAYVDVNEYKPEWNANEISNLLWEFETDKNGNPLIPQDSKVELNPVTGEISGIDMDGEYTVRYYSEDTEHSACGGTITYVVDRRATKNVEEDEIRNIIGSGTVIQNENGEQEKYALSFDTHGVSDGDLIGIGNNVQDKQNVLDGKLTTYAMSGKGLSLAQNNILLGVRALDGAMFGTDDGTGHLKKPVRIGFIVEDNASILGVKALNFLEMRVYDKQGEADPVYRSVIEENATVGVDLIGTETVKKQRYSILVPAGRKIFNEFSLWNCGVADINLSEMRIFGTFVEEVDPADINKNWGVGDNSDLIWKNATATVQSGAGAKVASGVLKNLDFLIDDDLNTAFVMGDGLGVAQGQTIHVDLGRVVQPSEKIGIILGNEYDVASVNAGNWMTMKLYAPAYSSQNEVRRRVQSADSPHTTMTDWSVAGVDVVGHGDRKGIYIVPKAPTSSLDMVLGDVATLANTTSVYGITVAPREDSKIYKLPYSIIQTSVGEVEAGNGCTIMIESDGYAVVTAPCEILGVRVSGIDGTIGSDAVVVDGNSAELRLASGVSLIQVTMADGHVGMFKVMSDR